MSDKYKLNPITGKLDIAGNSDDGREEVADWVQNTTTPKWPTKKSTEGMTAMQILKTLLFQDVMPNVTLMSTIVPGLREQGDSVEPTFTATPRQGTYNLVSMTLKLTGGVQYTETVENMVSGSSSPFAFKGLIETDTTVICSVTDADGNTVNSDSMKYTFGNYLYYGATTEDVSLANIDNAWLEANLTKQLKTGRTLASKQSPITVSITTPGSYVYLAMPTSWGCEEHKIYDANAGVSGCMECLGDIANYTNAHYANVSYRIFRSLKQDLNFPFYVS